MHAKLWLLIALARVALDNPEAIARYKSDLLAVVGDERERHVLVRHFAARALLACADTDAGKLPIGAERLLQNVDKSPHRRSRKRTRNRDDFWRSRPPGAPKRQSEFHLDYDFDKYDVQSLRGVFGKAGWEVHDLMSDIVQSIDPSATSMYESGGRERSAGSRLGGMTSRYHTYGQHLGWHALFLAAGRLLHDFPVTDDRPYDDPWCEWLSKYLLTREDGLWLSDGMDWTPLGLRGVLLEKGEKELVLTGDRSKILALTGLHSGVKGEVIVAGNWPSTDQIEVRIELAFVRSAKAAAAARRLVREKPMLAWLPTFSLDNDGRHYLGDKKVDCIPWITWPSAEGRLDNDDPLGSIHALRRPRVAGSFASRLGLYPVDPFERVWRNGGGAFSHSEAWGRAGDDGDHSGVCLSCSTSALQDLMNGADADLVLLIRLRRHERGFNHDPGRHTYSLAVARVTKSLEIKYYAGPVNYLHQWKY